MKKIKKHFKLIKKNIKKFWKIVLIELVSYIRDIMKERN